jgi:hypothetical protein
MFHAFSPVSPRTFRFDFRNHNFDSSNFAVEWLASLLHTRRVPYLNQKQRPAILTEGLHSAFLSPPGKFRDIALYLCSATFFLIHSTLNLNSDLCSHTTKFRLTESGYKKYVATKNAKVLFIKIN